ncbi:hypothetical protein HK101_002410 [Irineochytrium annulatum]|nr:hypothetical protein HK101_002410 [Irineochytrium annulatum]
MHTFRALPAVLLLTALIYLLAIPIVESKRQQLHQQKEEARKNPIYVQVMDEGVFPPDRTRVKSAYKLRRPPSAMTGSGGGRRNKASVYLMACAITVGVAMLL